MSKGLPLALVVLGAASVWGQNVISAKSGMVHYVEGEVMLDGQTIHPQFGEFPQVKDGGTLSTGQGRAEVLLTPGVFLRLAEHGSFRMISNQLADTSIEMLSGEALFEVDELLKDNAITVKYGDSSIALDKHGLYRIDADAASLMVYEGSAKVTSGEKMILAKKGKEVALDQSLAETSFNPKNSDPFYNWAERRSEYIATANVSAANSAYQSGFSSGGLIGGGYGSWAWNPYFGMFTYLPGVGYGYNPFGWAFYSPLTIGSFYYGYAGGYYPGYYGGSGGGYAGPAVGANSGPASYTPTRSAPPSSNVGGFSGGGVARSSGSLGGSASRGGGASMGGGAHGGGGGGGHR